MTAPPSRREEIAAAKARGDKLAVVLPIHPPRSLLRAFGFHAVEIWGPPGIDPTLGASHFQAYTCAIVRNATAFILGGKTDDADAIVIPHTCDALQGMASVLRDFTKTKAPVLPVYLPRGRRESDLSYFIDELKRLGQDLAAISGKTPTDGEFHTAIDNELAADAAFTGLCRERDGIALTDRQFFSLLRSREFVGPEKFIALCRAAPRGASPARGVPLMLSGIVPEPMAILDEIGEMGARVVADDMACLSRRIYSPVDDSDPYRRLSRILLRAQAEPTLGSDIDERTGLVRKKMEESGAKGLLVYDPKFCEPELFYLPLLKKGLEAINRPVLHIEFDMSDAFSAQTRTRIEAFVEMLR